MKTVTLTQDVRPWRKGDKATVPDDVADRLVENGEAEKPEKFPPADVTVKEVPGGRNLKKAKRGGRR